MKQIQIIIVLVVMVFAMPVKADTIHACVNKNNSKIRIVGIPGQCKDGRETPISWNTEGPAGPKGDRGDPGQPGAPGESLCVAGGATEFGIVGVTQATTDGFYSLFEPDQMCDTEYPGSRMCRSTTEWQTIGSGLDASELVASIPTYGFEETAFTEFTESAFWAASATDRCFLNSSNEPAGAVRLMGINRLQNTESIVQAVNVLCEDERENGRKYLAGPLRRTPGRLLCGGEVGRARKSIVEARQDGMLWRDNRRLGA